MRFDVAEAAAKREMLVRRNRLVAEEYHQMVLQRLPHCREGRVVQSLGQVDAVKLGAQGVMSSSAIAASRLGAARHTACARSVMRSRSQYYVLRGRLGIARDADRRSPARVLRRPHEHRAGRRIAAASP